MDFFLFQFIFVGDNILPEQFFDARVAENVIVRHLKWQLCESISLVYGTNLLIKK